MSELWERFELTGLPEERDLSRARFEELYRGRGPVVVRGGARDMPAFARWDADYLASQAGQAMVNVAAYASDRRDYGVVRPRHMTLAEFLASMAEGPGDEVRYLFNNASCIFLRNEDQPRFHIGWAANVNPGLASLGDDFRVPAFVDPEKFVAAVIILGSQENATDLHYDNGGEGKVLVQLRGRKRILLLPPTSAEALQLQSIFRAPDGPEGQSGSRPALNIHAPGDADGLALSGYTVELEPGDIAYWPPFWFHDIANLEPFTLAAGLMVDEITLPPLLVRHLAHAIFREVLRSARKRAGEGSEPFPLAEGWNLRVALGDTDLGSLAQLMRDVEERLLGEASADTSQLWNWNARLGQE